MTMSSRLRRNSISKRYAKHTDEEPDEDAQFSGKEEHDVHLTCNKENVSPRRTVVVLQGV